MTLWHFTCDHGRNGIGNAGKVIPGVQLVPLAKQGIMPWQAHLSWFTDLDTPIADALGLTSLITPCRRTTNRYRVLDDTGCKWWMDVRGQLPREAVDSLEMAPGARPVHWWVSDAPVPVEYDPQRWKK